MTGEPNNHISRWTGVSGYAIHSSPSFHLLSSFRFTQTFPSLQCLSLLTYARSWACCQWSRQDHASFCLLQTPDMKLEGGMPACPMCVACNLQVSVTRLKRHSWPDRSRNTETQTDANISQTLIAQAFNYGSTATPGVQTQIQIPVPDWPRTGHCVTVT
jgi:hypothetical protein